MLRMPSACAIAKLESPVYTGIMSTLPPLERLVSIVPKAPRAPTFPTEAQVHAWYETIAVRQKELDEVKAHMVRVHEAATVRPKRRK